MKLRNKKTGEIREIKEILIDKMFTVNSLAELNEEWEDYKEPKEYWYICSTRNYEITRVIIDEGTDFDRVQKDKEIGNYFETYEEAEKAVKKLNAWKRLKDKGFDLEAVVEPFFCLDIYMADNSPRYQELKEDLIIVFGGDNESSN